MEQKQLDWYNDNIKSAQAAGDIDMANSLIYERDNFDKLKTAQNVEDAAIRKHLADNKLQGKFELRIGAYNFKFGWVEIAICVVILYLLFWR